MTPVINEPPQPLAAFGRSFTIPPDSALSAAEVTNAALNVIGDAIFGDLPHEIAAIFPVKPPPGLRTSTIAQ